MSLYLIFSIITVFLALAFVLIHLAAAVSAILKGKKSLGTSSTICGGALLNGQNNKNFNKSHHQIRFVIDLIITFLLYVWLYLFQ